MTRDVALVGSIPLGSAEAVFEAVGETLDGLVRRVPDGENAERLNWAHWQAQAFERIPFVEEVRPEHETPMLATTGGRGPAPQFRVKPGFPTAAVRFGPLGYAASAKRSYESFAALRAAGKLPPESRFQIGMATALSVIGQHVDARFQQAIEPAYERRLREEVDDIAGSLPHGDIAIQWNLATELTILLGHRPIHFAKLADGILERLGRLCERVPEDIQLGLHFCVHDFADNGFPLPDSLDPMVDLAAGVMGTAGRRIDWLHMAVPGDAADEAFFAPLSRLPADGETALYLGLIDPADGLDGATRRIALARRAVERFGIGGPCGFGRASAEETRSLLALHREAATMA